MVIEQDEESTLASHPLVKNIKYLHVYNPGAFNKSWGMNVAFKQSSGDILVVSDADMIVQADALQRAVSACEKELDAVRPYGRLIDMTEGETEESGRDFLWHRPHHRRFWHLGAGDDGCRFRRL